MSWYNLCKKYKILNWIDDYIVWYVWDKPKSTYKTIKYWFYCNWNKEHYRLVKRAFTSYPWDYYFMYELMEYQIDKQIRWFNKHNNFEHGDTDVVRPLKWAKYCVHTMINDTELYDYDIEQHKSIYTGPRVNYRNIKRFHEEFHADFRGKPTFDQVIEYYKNYPEQYYILKCRHLLFKILKQYSFRWWD